MQLRFPSADWTPQCLSGSYSRDRSPLRSADLPLAAETELLLLLLLLLLVLVLLPFPLVVLEDDDEDDDEEEEDEEDGSLLELLRFPPFPDGDALMDDAVLLLSLLTPDEVDEEEPFLSSRVALDDELLAATGVAAVAEPEVSCLALLL